MNATVFDDGTHQEPNTHAETPEAGLVFVPRVLLRNGIGREPLDWDLIDDRTGTILVDRYLDRYRQKLIPAFAGFSRMPCLRAKLQWLPYPVSEPSVRRDIPGNTRRAFRTRSRSDPCPIGRPPHGRSPDLLRPLQRMYGPGTHLRSGQLADTSLLTRWTPTRSTLQAGSVHSEEGDDFTHARLYSLVAWDPVSWPDNDFYAGVRATDDGVKAAATDVISRLTGLAEEYDPAAYGYRPPATTATGKTRSSRRS